MTRQLVASIPMFKEGKAYIINSYSDGAIEAVPQSNALPGTADQETPIPQTVYRETETAPQAPIAHVPQAAPQYISAPVPTSPATTEPRIIYVQQSTTDKPQHDGKQELNIITLLLLACAVLVGFRILFPPAPAPVPTAYPFREKRCEPSGLFGWSQICNEREGYRGAGY